MMFIRSTMTLIVCALLGGYANADWKQMPSGTMAWFHAVHFVDAKKGWIAGSKGTLLSTQDGGNNWSIVPRITNDSIRDLYFADELRGWLLCERPVFGANGTLAYLMVTADGGKTWQTQEPFQKRERVVRLIFQTFDSGCAIGEGGYVSCTRDGGISWQRYELPLRYLMLDGRFTDEETLILAGGGGSVLRSERGRTDWMRVATPVGNTTKINSLYFLDRKNGWAVGADGRILYTASGGQIWSVQASPVTKELKDVYFAGPSRGYAVGDEGVIIQTKDGGRNWVEEMSPTKHRLESLAAAGRRFIAVGFGGTILVNDELSEPQ